MGFFGGPSKNDLLAMSQGIAAIAMHINVLHQLDSEQKEIIRNEMRDEGAPTTMGEFVQMTSSLVREQNMGWYKKNQFLGMIFGSLLRSGFSMTDASRIKKDIELLT